jgi:hypothetical protein
VSIAGSAGWITYKLIDSDQHFPIDDELSIKMIIWAVTTLFNNHNLEVEKQNIVNLALFKLTISNSIAELPELWQPDKFELLSEMIQNTIQNLGIQINEQEWLNFQEIWIQCVRVGRILKHIKSIIKGKYQEELLKQIPNSKLCKGDVIYQGTLGYCIITEISNNTKIYAKSLHDTTLTRQFAKKSIITLTNLIQSKELFGDRLNDDDKNAISHFFTNLTTDLENLVI